MRSASCTRLLCTYVLALIASSALFGDAVASEQRPNILVLYTDDQRFDSLAAFGNPVIQTPSLDRLAREGTVFTNAFVTTAICAVSRASLITGQYSSRHGVHDFQTPLAPEALAETFPMLLRAAGYRVGFIGKWGLGNPLPEESYDFWRGFPGQGRFFEPDEPELHLTDRQADQALEFLAGCQADAPFCLQISFKAPHCHDRAEREFQPAARFESLYADVEIPLAPTANEAAFARLPPFLRESEARVRWERRFATPEVHQATVRDYYRLITGVDDAVGRILRRLEEQGLADNTVVLFSSDNGFYLGEHGLAGKWFMHEESIRVPLVILDPRLPAASRAQHRDEMALNIDLAPTILDLADVPVPDRMQGTSLAPLVAGTDAPWRDEWFYEHRFEHAGIPQSEGIRGERWKYVRYLLPEGNVEQLFDLQLDPHEEHDLADEPSQSDQLADLRRRCDEWMKRVK